MSTSTVVSEIVKFEKTAPDTASLARQMSALLPELSSAKDLQCEYSQKRARLIIKTEAAEQVIKFTQEERPSKVIPASVVMFEYVHGSKWLVGVKASTSPFSPEPIESLLKHEKLQLPLLVVASRSDLFPAFQGGVARRAGAVAAGRAFSVTIPSPAAPPLLKRGGDTSVQSAARNERAIRAEYGLGRRPCYYCLP